MYICACSSLEAQKLQSGSLSLLKNETQLNIVFDYYYLKIEGIRESDFAATKSESDQVKWENSKKQFLAKFMAGFNKRVSGKILAGIFPDVKYKLTVIMLTLDDDCDMVAQVVFSEQNSTTPIAVFSLKGNAGRFGSQSNLIGDACLDAGEKTGKFIAKQLNKK